MTIGAIAAGKRALKDIIQPMPHPSTGGGVYPNDAPHPITDARSFSHNYASDDARNADYMLAALTNLLGKPNEPTTSNAALDNALALKSRPRAEGKKEVSSVTYHWGEDVPGNGIIGDIDEVKDYATHLHITKYDDGTAHISMHLREDHHQAVCQKLGINTQGHSAA